MKKVTLYFIFNRWYKSIKDEMLEIEVFNKLRH